MKRLLTLAVAAVFCSSVQAADKETEKETPAKPEAAKPDAAAPKEAKSHDGTWKPIAAVLGGMKMPKPVLDAITLKIAGGNYEVTIKGEPEPDKGTCTMDTEANPKRMTIKGVSGPNKGKTFLAIYEMKDAGSLRVCYDLSGAEFPKEFKAPKGTQLYLVGYRRQKEDAAP